MSSEVWALRGVTVPDGEPAEWWVRDGALTRRPVDGAEMLPGRYFAAGLVDAHCHLTLLPSAHGPVAAPAEHVQRLLGQLVQAGVLAVRDTGAHDDTAVRLSLAADPLVRVVACGRFLASPGNYFPGVFDGVEAHGLAAAGVEQIRAGATWVKLVADFPPGADFSRDALPNFPIEAVRALVDAVHAAGGRVAAHVVLPMVRELVDAGVDSVEHGTGLEPDILETMAARGTAWTPTLQAVISALPPDAPPEWVRQRDDRVAAMRALLPSAVRLGVPVLAGSDVVGTVAGEVAKLVELGLDPSDALRAATTTARDFFGLPGLGEGAPADVVSYDADPRADPEVLCAPAAVLRRGRRVR
jgi:imidazolonepropionase-like amidohydrolase